VTLQEVSDLVEEELSASAELLTISWDCLTAEDLAQLSGQIPPNTSAIVILFEHTWVIGLTEAVRKSGAWFSAEEWFHTTF